jgi:hypothetical protein
VSENFTPDLPRNSLAPNWLAGEHNRSRFEQIGARRRRHVRSPSMSENFTTRPRAIRRDAADQAFAARREGRHGACRPHRSDVANECSAMKRYMIAALLIQAASVSAQETGLSKGPFNPADIGSRCAVLAGRDDRAYLNCLETQGAPPSARPAVGTQRSITDHPDSGNDPRSLERYLRRDR